MMPRPGDQHIGRGQGAGRVNRNQFLKAFGTGQAKVGQKVKQVVYAARSHRGKGSVAIDRGAARTVDGNR